MSELRNKILTFRDKLDLPPCNVSASVLQVAFWYLLYFSYLYFRSGKKKCFVLSDDDILQLVIVSVKDLHKLYPDIVAKNSMSETKGTSMNQVK